MPAVCESVCLTLPPRFVQERTGQLFRGQDDQGVGHHDGQVRAHADAPHGQGAPPESRERFLTC